MTFKIPTEKTLSLGFDEIDLLVDEAAKIPGLRTSEIYHRQFIRDFGQGLFREALGELRMRMLTTEIREPGAYFNGLLKKWREERDLYGSPERPGPTRALAQNPTCLDDFKPLPLVQPDLYGSPAPGDRLMEMPYSPDLFQWASHLGNEFFTLTNEKAKSDSNTALTLEIDGLAYKVPMLRGKLYRDDKSERGIPTTEHMRILHAIEAIWASKGGPHEIDSNGFVICKILIPVLDIARYLGLSPGGREYKRIIDKAVDLSTMGYVFLTKDLPGYTHNGKTLEDVPFKFFGEAKPMSVRDNATGKKTSYLRIVFSEQYSRWLLSGRVVSRPLELLQKRGDISFKLAVYLFPILMKRGEHSIELNELIDRIGLKRTGWSAHIDKGGFKSQRKREFEKALKELNGMPSGDGRVFSLQIIQGLNSKDYMLVARLISQDAEGGGAR